GDDAATQRPEAPGCEAHRALAPLDRGGREVGGPLVLYPAGERADAIGGGPALAAQCDRRLRARPAGIPGIGPDARGRSRHLDPPGQPRPDRPAPDPRGGGRLRTRPRSRCLRAACGPAARLAALRRTPGAALARPGALCRYQRLREGRPPIDLAVTRLGPPRLQSGPDVRPGHD